MSAPLKSEESFEAGQGNGNYKDRSACFVYLCKILFANFRQFEHSGLVLRHLSHTTNGERIELPRDFIGYVF